MRRLVAVLPFVFLLTACPPPDDEEGLVPTADAGAELEAPPGLAELGDDCRCPAGACDPDGEVCACEGEMGSGPCGDGLVCLGGPEAGECLAACDDRSPCPDGFDCIPLQVGTMNTGSWCFVQ